MTSSDVAKENKAKKLKIVLIGPPGSGKSLQATSISKKYNLVHISTGKLLREIAGEESSLGHELRKRLQEGDLIPDQLVNTVLQKRLPSDGYVLDGYPRRVSQADFLKGVDMVMYLDVSDEIIRERIMKRGEGREDDKFEVIDKRIMKFQEEKQPIIAYFKKIGVLFEVNADNSPEKVFSDIEDIIEKNKFVVS